MDCNKNDLNKVTSGRMNECFLAAKIPHSPDDCPPITTICGKFIVVVCPNAPNTSCNFPTIGINCSIYLFMFRYLLFIVGVFV